MFDVRFCFADPVAQYLMDDPGFMDQVHSAITHVEYSQDVCIVAGLVTEKLYGQYRGTSFGGELLSDLVFNLLELTDTLRIAGIILKSIFEEADL